MIRPEDVRKLLQGQPFRPFRISLSNGQTFEVKHSELAFVTKSTIILAKPVPGSEEPIGDGIDLISVLHINNVEVIPTKKASKH